MLTNAKCLNVTEVCSADWLHSSVPVWFRLPFTAMSRAFAGRAVPRRLSLVNAFAVLKRCRSLNHIIPVLIMLALTDLAAGCGSGPEGHDRERRRKWHILLYRVRSGAGTMVGLSASYLAT